MSAFQVLWVWIALQLRCASAGFFLPLGKRVAPLKAPEPAFVQQSVNPSTQLCLESFKELLSKTPTSPSFQRGVKDERVARLVAEIKHYRNTETKENLEKFPVPFLNTLNIANLRGKFYIVDGQHRFAAYLDVYKREKVDFNVCYILKDCKTLQDMKTYFIDINTQLAQQEVMFALSSMDLKETVATYIQSKYAKHISTSEKPRWPNINVDALANFLFVMLRDEQSTNGLPPAEVDFDNIIDRIEEENDKAGKLLLQLERDKPDKFAGKHKNASDKQGLFISIIMSQSKEAENASNRAVNLKPKPKPKPAINGPRRSVPSRVRKLVWKRDFAASMVGRCYTCEEKITFDKFEAGHRTAVANGGDDSVSNIVCQCKECNRSQYTMDIEEFKLLLRH